MSYRNDQFGVREEHHIAHKEFHTVNILYGKNIIKPRHVHRLNM